MRKKYKFRKRKPFVILVLKIIIVFLLLLGVVKIVSLGGKFFYTSDKIAVSKVDVETFRSTLNLSLPIMDTIYNSGNSSLSFSGQVRELINGIFHFDLNQPISILNAQSPYFRRYYSKDYTRLAQKGPGNEIYIARIDGDNEDSEGVKPKFKEAVSSIYSGEDDGELNREISEPNISYDKIAINNYETNYKIDIEEIMKEPLKLDFDKKGPKVLIYHTHTSESFIKDISELKKSGIQNRTSDSRYNVVRVGEELAQTLRKKYDIEVIHNATFHNYPDDTGAYGRSLNTSTSILKSYPSIKVVFDIHRDGADNQKLRVSTKVNGKDCAKVMFVVGTNYSGLDHPEWKENLKFAITLQQKLNEEYPGLARPIFISKNRYNQHVTNNTLIIEIGGDGNTLNEALESARLLANVINRVISNGK